MREVEESIGLSGIEPQRPLVGVDGLVQSVDVLQAIPEVDEHARLIGPDLQRPPVEADGLLVLRPIAALAGHSPVRVAHPSPGARVERPLAHGVLPDGLLGGVVQVAAEGEDAECEHGSQRGGRFRARGKDQMSAHHQQEEQSRRRQVEPVFGDHFADHRDDAGGGREQEEESQREEPRGRPFEPQPDAERGQREHCDRLGDPVAERVGHRHARAALAIVEDQPDRDHDQPQVVKDGPELDGEVLQRPEAGKVESCRELAGAGRDLQRQHQPGGGERDPEPPPGAEGLRPRIEEEGAVEEHDQDRGHRHRLLGRHSQAAGEHGRCIPGEGPLRLVRPQRGVEREQQEEGREAFHPLHQVGHAFGLHRMQQPEQRGAERKGIGAAADPLVEPRR